MAEELQSLLEKINEEGIKKAEEAKNKIICDAKAEAEKIISDATAKAHDILKSAQDASDREVQGRSRGAPGRQGHLHRSPAGTPEQAQERRQGIHQRSHDSRAHGQDHPRNGQELHVEISDRRSRHRNRAFTEGQGFHGATPEEQPRQQPPEKTGDHARTEFRVWFQDIIQGKRRLL